MQVIEALKHIEQLLLRLHNRGTMCLAIFLMVMVTCTTGCKQDEGVLFTPLDSEIRWPPAPEIPRIRYVGSISNSSDLKPEKSFGTQIGEFLFGKESTHSMLTPFAVCKDDQDRLFVCDSNAQMIHVFDLKTRVYEQWRPDTETAMFSQPVGIAIDQLGRLLVSDALAGVVFVFDFDGDFLGTIGADHLDRPCGIAVDPTSDRLFIADVATHQVVVLSMDGKPKARIGRRGSGPGEFNFPTNVTVDSVGRLYVSDSLNFRVQVFDPDFNFLRQIGSKGDLPGYFSQPKGIAVDSDHHLYVVDAHFEAVQVFDLEGNLLLSFGEEGRGSGQFWLPVGIHIDSENRIWVADSYNQRVQVFQYEKEVQP